MFIFSSLIFLAVSVLSEEYCGRNIKSTPLAVTDIAGERQQSKGVAPYMASVRLDGEHVCGGAILNDRWILTAAVCLKNIKLKIRSSSVVVGTENLEEKGVEYKTANAIVHEHYDEINKTNNIGMVKVLCEIQFNDIIKPIDIDFEYCRDGEPKCDHTVMFTGWGAKIKNEEAEPILKVIQLGMIPVKQCQELTKERTGAVDTSNICTLTKPGYIGFIGGEGCPVIYNGKLIGITSWGGCKKEQQPNVFTRATSHLDWINIGQVDDFMDHYNNEKLIKDK